MGSSISVDKHVSNLDDLLDISPKLFQKIKFEGNISDSVTEHLKVGFASSLPIDLALLRRPQEIRYHQNSGSAAQPSP